MNYDYKSRSLLLCLFVVIPNFLTFLKKRSSLNTWLKYIIRYICYKGRLTSSQRIKMSGFVSFFVCFWLVFGLLPFVFSRVVFIKERRVGLPTVL